MCQIFDFKAANVTFFLIYSKTKPLNSTCGNLCRDTITISTVHTHRQMESVPAWKWFVFSVVVERGGDIMVRTLTFALLEELNESRMMMQCHLTGHTEGNTSDSLYRNTYTGWRRRRKETSNKSRIKYSSGGVV